MKGEKPAPKRGELLGKSNGTRRQEAAAIRPKHQARNGNSMNEGSRAEDLVREKDEVKFMPGENDGNFNSRRWVALYCVDESLALIQNHPNAFLLLAQIAMRARWKDCPITKLKQGQALIGDWQNGGLTSDGAYRYAKDVLSECGLATFEGTNKGTIATLANSMIFSITRLPRNEQGNDQTTGKRRTNSGQATTNHTDTQIDGNTDTSFEGEKSTSPCSKMAEEIYQRYPRKVAKGNALKAIRNAMKLHDASWLLKKVEAYAKAINWQENRYIPYPATWFNAERFNDDPKEWEKPAGTVAKSIQEPNEARRGHEQWV